ncbi:MAG: hypothetical protein EPN55_04070 [Gammaproteobacteria bacterium]|nr:MAG: hypothetical protein EPN55_04070 [Gammaproteobacteria bacterium]
MQQRGGHEISRVRRYASVVPILPALLFIAPLVASAAGYKPPESALEGFEKFDETKVEKWKELESPLPSWPEDARLIPVRMPVTYTLKIYVDEKSVSRLADGIARFTLVVESSSGVRNVFFEGYNCETREYKTYAAGTPDKTFEPIKKPKWERVQYYDVNAFRFQFLRYYVCDPDSLSSALRPQDFVRRLKDATRE